MQMYPSALLNTSMGFLRVIEDCTMPIDALYLSGWDYE